MSKHYLLQKQNGIIIKKTVKDWARENQEKFPGFGFRNGSTEQTPTSEQIDKQLKKESFIQEIFNGNFYCYDPKEISENDFKSEKFKRENTSNFNNKTVKPNKTIISNTEKEKSDIEVHPYLTTKGFIDQLNFY